MATATQIITVEDNTAPEFECTVAPEITADCKEIPAKEECKATDNCGEEVPVMVEDVYGYDEELKMCFITRTYSAADLCGNTAQLVQTIWLNGECCKKEEVAGKSMDVSVTPNPFRDACVIAFTSQENATAVMRIFDLNGRPVVDVLNRAVHAGEEVRVPFSAGQVQRGVYQYRLSIGGKEISGRLIVD
jgi:hypothetical protein